MKDDAAVAPAGELGAVLAFEGVTDALGTTAVLEDGAWVADDGIGETLQAVKIRQNVESMTRSEALRQLLCALLPLTDDIQSIENLVSFPEKRARDREQRTENQKCDT